MKTFHRRAYDRGVEVGRAESKAELERLRKASDDFEHAARKQADVYRAQLAVTVEALNAAYKLLDRDQTGLAAALVEVKTHVKCFDWIMDGRGSYEWDDDRYREEVGHAFLPVPEMINKALGESGTRAVNGCRTISDALARIEAMGSPGDPEPPP